MANCQWCGEETGDGRSDRYESCGKRDCDREIRYAMEADRLDAIKEAGRRFDEEWG